MQINGSSLHAAPMRAIKHPQPAANAQLPFAPATATTPSETTSQASGILGGPAQQQVDVATVLAHWGTSNPLADLNVDGIVDASDLSLASSQQNSGTGSVLENWGQGGASDLNGDGTIDAQDLAQALSGQGDAAANAAWSNATGGDQDGNGSVNAQDLATMLNGQSLPAGGATPSPLKLVEGLVESAFASRDADQDGSVIASDFHHGSKIFERLDLDGSGKVGREEMTKALMVDFNHFRDQFPEASPSAFARRWGDAFSGMRPTPDTAAFARIQHMLSNPANFGRQVSSGILSARA